MKTIWKYSLTPGNTKFCVPAGGIIRHVDEQFGNICLWIEVNTDSAEELRSFAVYATGQKNSEENIKYLGSVKLEGGALVYHVYERLKC